MKKILLLLFPFYCVAQTPPICFNITSTLSVGANPQEITTGDFNIDGNIDLAVTNSGANTISVLLGTGTGTFSAAVNYTTASQPQGIVNGDFNNDGKLDLAVANFAGNSISILMGNGTGTFLTPVNYTASNPTKIAIGDYNSDGNIDLAVSNYGSNKVSILMGSPTGTFASSVLYNVGVQPLHVTSADLNNDGKLDLVVSHFSSTFISVLLNTGTGTFNTAVNYATGFNNGSTVICRDFDGDSKIDIIVGTTGKIHFFKGLGTGTFSSVINTIPQSQPYSMVCKDYNGDGIFDLITGSGSVTISTYTISPTATFTSVGNYTTSVFDYSDVATNDFNNDGKFDLAVSSYGTNKVIIFINGLPNVIATSSASLICNGNSAVLNATGANTYTWSTGVSSMSISVSPTITTTYTLIGSGLNGCSNSSTITIGVNTPTITVNSGSICTGASFTISPLGASTYTYSGGSTIVSPITATNYTVTGANALGCTNTAVSSVSVNALPIVNATTSSSLICTGSTATLTASGATSYTWNTGTTLVNYPITPTTTTSYTLVGTDINGCKNNTVITQSVSLCTGINEISNENLISIYPNPNNGIFTIRIEKEAQIVILNQLGEIMIEQLISSGNNIINIENLASGIYFVKVNQKGTLNTFKIIKN